MAPLIYLDFDGVVVVPADRRPGADRDYLAPDRVALVQWLCDQTGAKVVVSSSWRVNDTCRQALVSAGLSPNVIFHDWLTPLGSDAPDGISIRGFQIDLHVRSHSVSQYLILDDWPVCAHQAEHHIQTDDRIGLTNDHMPAAVAILSRPVGHTKRDIP